MKFETDYEVDFSNRDPAGGTDELFYKRWSPRSFKKVEIAKEVLESIFDAARWSPSCYNEQPWLLVTSSGDGDMETFLDLLVEGNRAWAKNASLIGFIFSKKRFTHNDRPNAWASFDCGSAWMSIALQASLYGLYAHGMAGIKKDEVCKRLNVPGEDYDVICGFALGVIDCPQRLDADMAKREVPSQRKPLSEVWIQGVKE